MTESKKTPLFSWHESHGGRIVDFAGWQMPVQFAGINQEHKTTRTKAGLFDVSHMGELFLEGPDALSNLRRLLTNDPASLKIGQVQYSPMLYPGGTTVDDLSVYKLGEESYMLCVNASNAEKDYQWIKENLQGQVSFENRSHEYGQIALQGPNAERILSKILDLDLGRIRYWWFERCQHDGVELIVARMGYTGEDGFEIFLPWEKTLSFWEEIVAQGEPEGLEPIGLGARDTLRLEVAYPLYGQEIDDQRLITAAGMKRFIKMDKDFIGKEALQSQTPGEILVGLEMIDKGVPRSHYPIENEAGEMIGEVTSGSVSPMSGKGVAMAYVKREYAELGSEVKVAIRTKRALAKVVKMPFYQREK